MSDIETALRSNDREALRAIVVENGYYLGRLPTDMREDPELQRIACQTNPHALRYATHMQSNYEVVLQCVKCGYQHAKHAKLVTVHIFHE